MENNRKEIPDKTQKKTSAIFDQLIQECEAMLSYALGTGKRIPGSLIQKLDDISTKSSTEGQLSSESQQSPENTVVHTGAKPGSNSGTKNRISQLAGIHNQLVQIVHPAKPSTILLLKKDEQTNSFLSALGPLPIIRRMMVTSLILTVAFVLVSLSDYVNTKSIAAGVFTSGGIQLFMNLLFLLTAAGIGASFSALFNANKYITEGTYDPKYESSYWIRFVLGLIAGLLLAELIPVDASQSLESISKPLLALLGGFSSSVVYKVMNRLVTTVETLISGKTNEIIAAQNQDLQNHLNREIIQNKLNLATDVLKLQKEISTSDNADDVKKKLNSLMDKLLPPEDETP